MRRTDCTVLVTSCDAYLDVVGPFAQLKSKYWPDCPFETVLLSETLPSETDLTAINAGDGKVSTDVSPAFDRIILTGLGKTWCQMLVEALDRIESPYVILQMNDFMLASPVSTEKILFRIEQAKRYDAANLRLVPNPPGRVPWVDSDLMLYPKNTAYCVSCQTGIWNREYLRELARRNKSAWEFERFGSFMVGGEARPILVTPERDMPDVDTVHKGYWVSEGVTLLRENGVVYDFGKRGTQPLAVKLREGVKSLIFACFPLTLIVRIQNLLGVGMKEKCRKQ